MSQYRALKDSDEYQEAKPLVHDQEDLESVDSSQAVERTLSWKATLAVYALCLATVVFAAANTFAALRTNTAAGAVVDVDSLPRPDVFMGIPKSRTFDTGSAVHDHTHACKVFVALCSVTYS